MDNHTKQLLGLTDKHFIPAEDWLAQRTKEGQTTHVIKGYWTSESSACPTCSHPHTIKHGTYLTTTLLPKFNYYKTVLELKRTRFKCQNPDCGITFSLPCSLVDKYCAISRPLVHLIALDLKKNISRKQICRDHHVSQVTVTRVMVRYASYFKQSFTHLPTVLCLDEFKGDATPQDKMSCICVDGDNKRILDILPNRRLNTIIRYFMQFPLVVRQRVRYLVIDMNAHYQKLLRVVFPNAQLVTDRFHIIQHINRSFNQLRIQVMKQFKATTREYRRLKRFWKPLLMDAYNLNSIQWRYNHSFKRFMTQAGIVDELLSYDDTLKRAYQAVQQLKDAYRHRDTAAFFVAIDTLDQRLPLTFRRKFNIFYRFKQGIENAFNCHYSNGITEGINNKIKVIKRVAYGYRNFHYFRLRILINQSYFLFGS